MKIRDCPNNGLRNEIAIKLIVVNLRVWVNEIRDLFCISSSWLETLSVFLIKILIGFILQKFPLIMLVETTFEWSGVWAMNSTLFLGLFSTSFIWCMVCEKQRTNCFSVLLLIRLTTRTLFSVFWRLYLACSIHFNFFYKNQ